MNTKIVVVIGGILVLASISMGCVDTVVEPTYTIEIVCPLDSYRYTGLTCKEVEEIRAEIPFYCSVGIYQE